VIHTHNTQPLLDGVIGTLLSGVKCIVHTDHARAFPDKKRYMVAERMASFFVHKMVGVSKDTTHNLHKYEHIHSKKLMVIHNGINFDRFQISINKEKKRKELGIKNNGPIIGMVGRLSNEKGISYLLNAMPEVIQKIPTLNLIIAGNGSEEKKLKEEASKLNINNNVFFIGARMDIPEVLNVLDVFVLPSLREGLPMVLLEAMAAGCAIIASDVGGIPTLIKNDWNGLLIPPASPPKLSKAILELISDNSKRTNMIENSSSSLTKFSATEMARQYEDLYTSGLQK